MVLSTIPPAARSRHLIHTLTRTLAGAIMALVVTLGALSFLFAGPLANTPLSQALHDIGSNMEYAALNAALDASGVKGAAESALRDNASGIASTTGLSEQEVNRAIDELDISSWRVTELPSQATLDLSVQASYQGSSTTITTYDDPSYITIDALGQHATLLVPDGAQDHVAHLLQSMA